MLAVTHWRRAFDVGGLTALALAYPLLEVLSRSPEFFVARNTTVVQVFSLVSVICFLLPTFWFAVQLVWAGTRPRATTVAHTGLLTLLVMAMGMTWVNRVDYLQIWVGAAVVLVLGLLFVVGYRRTSAVPLFVTALSPAILVVPLWFSLNDAVRDAVIPTTEQVQTVEFDEVPPIVFVVFDELPLISLLDENLAIDTVRYPSLAALAKHSYWFRNTTTVSSETMWAVPAMVAGQYPFEQGAVPTRRYYPNNLFTVLSGQYEMTVFGRFLQLCPPSSCVHDQAMPEESLGRLLADASLISAHILLPEPVTRHLPTITGDWVGLARARAWRGREIGEAAEGRAAEFERFLEAIEPGADGRLYFLHSLLPHMPFEYVPSGHRYLAADYQGRQVEGKRLFEATDRAFVDVLYQRHLLQVGFVDRLVGRLVERLRSQGMYDDTLVVVTSDHGASYQPGLPRRMLTERNAADIALVPLLIKLPGQQIGVVSESNAQTIDILPTLADALSIELPFGIDGQSLFDRENQRGEVKWFVQRNLENVAVETLGDIRSLSQASLERKVSTFGTRSRRGLYALGRSVELLGMDVSAVVGGRRNEVQITSSNLRFFDDVVRARPSLPLHVTGVLDTGRAEPIQLAVALNGTIAATTESYRQNGEWAFAAMLSAELLGDGRNEVTLFVIESENEEPSLSPVMLSADR